MSHLSLQTSKPVYYIVDCRIFRMLASFPCSKDELTHFFFFAFYVDKQEVSFKIDKNISYNSAIWSNSILAIWCQIYLFLALHYITFRRSKNIALFQLSVHAFAPTYTTPLRQWGVGQSFSFSWTTLKGKHCWHPIAIMGVVDTFRLCVASTS